MSNPLSHLKDEIISNNSIPNEKYAEFEVKRGLRNADGTGVLAGLSRISSVVGTQKIDHESVPVEGVLKYRGVSLIDFINDLGNSEYRFEQTAFFLLVGRKPTDSEFDAFNDLLKDMRILPDYLIDHCIKGIPSKNIMNKLQTAVSALYAADEDADSLDSYENFIKAVGLVAKMPKIVAYSYLTAYKPNAPLVTVSDDVSIAEAFLTILYEGRKPSALEVEILDLCLLLHAEHGGGNNSTFTTYVTTSSGTDIYSSLAAAIASLKGPLHGSANKMVMEMMDDVKANVKDWESETQISDYLTKIINKQAHDKSGKIYGLGHAVYTKSDPRAVVLKEKAHELAKDKGREKELGLYLAIETLGPKLFEEIKGSKKVIAPNVDFFSGFVYDCLGLPEEIYTPMFAMARAVGWCAHRIEETLSGKRIIRPGYKYIP
jgi:citrate synthase